MNFLTFDTETESTNLALSRPWQFAYSIANKYGVQKQEDIYIDIPNLYVSSGAARITGFDRNYYNRNKRPLQECCDLIWDLIMDPNYILVGHNILGFDVYQLQTLMAQVGKRLPWSFLNRCVDTHCLARGLAYRSTPPSMNQPDFLLWQYKMLHRIERGVKTSIRHLCGEYEIDFDPERLHDALYDIDVNYKLFMKMIYEIDLDFSAWE